MYLYSDNAACCIPPHAAAAAAHVQKREWPKGVGHLLDLVCLIATLSCIFFLSLILMSLAVYAHNTVVLILEKRV